jgi:hypothetical protein
LSVLLSFTSSYLILFFLPSSSLCPHLISV